MSDKQKMPVDGGGRNMGKPDGVSGAPDGGETHGRAAGGESNGSAYPNPYTGKKATNSGATDHGGQTVIDYYGGDNPNASTGMAERDDRGRAATPTAERKPREVAAGGRSFSIVEESGVVAAETAGKVATDEPYEHEQEQPGSG